MVKPKIVKDLNPLDDAELGRVHTQLFHDRQVPELAVVQRLLNDLLRSQLEADTYFSGLGPADWDFKYDAAERMYSKRVQKDLGLV